MTVYWGYASGQTASFNARLGGYLPGLHTASLSGQRHRTSLQMHAETQNYYKTGEVSLQFPAQSSG